MRRKKTPEEEMDNDQHPLRPKANAGGSGGKDGGDDSKETIQDMEDDHSSKKIDEYSERIKKSIADTLSGEK